MLTLRDRELLKKLYGKLITSEDIYATVEGMYVALEAVHQNLHPINSLIPDFLNTILEITHTSSYTGTVYEDIRAYANKFFASI